jgi:predicted metalloendopeptidase
MVDQYSAITLLDGQAKVNGQLTLGENIADNGGVKESFAAFKAQMAAMDEDDREDEVEKIEEVFGGLSPEQLFFVSFAQVWCEKARPEYVQLMLQLDPHSPGSVRATVPLQNFPEFAEAFKCKAGSVMNPAKRCSVW